ncbi:CLUMA_CG004315, isoform A [Clunio marinus]|uniref:CLUMA_CG004315, isoform A n=1 Tax=Clunio marinus TaxID=568069 RepID=A0A1J1HRG4_9DIPT|nr:CLUMA_CG004315, isoform A [Clunio marinus]
MDKLHSYQGFSGRFHEWRDDLKAKFANWREDHEGESLVDLTKNYASRGSANVQGSSENKDDYSHIYRRKSRYELIKLSLSVCGIELAYASETAFVSPTLLKIGVQHQHMTLVWALSPVIGFFLTPLLGSLSDRCHHPMGRRRPFIILLSIGVLLGLLLVPNGEDIGYSLGDFYSMPNETIAFNQTKLLPHRTSAIDSDQEFTEMLTTTSSSHTWGIFFTILGTVLLDFDADACQSPSRAYLLDVTLPEDHARGLSTFTIMAGLGGAFGYSLGGINWDATQIGVLLGGNVRSVFTLITITFVICVSITVTSFHEIPLALLESFSNLGSEKEQASNSYGAMDQGEDDQNFSSHQKKKEITLEMGVENAGYSSLPGENVAETSFSSEENKPPILSQNEEGVQSLSYYLKSIIFMPFSLRMVCLTNLFCWMAHVCYSLYFTDFVGEAVFNGDPKAIYGSEKYILYEEGVRFGCFGMAMYSLSCACYSLCIEKLIARYRAKRVYIGGLLFYCASMTLMALTKHKIGVIFFSWGAGVMYSTLFTMPYLLVAHYHAQGVFELSETGESKYSGETRGIGTDVAIVSSMVFLAQFILSCAMGQIVSITQTTTAVVSTAAFLSFCGAINMAEVSHQISSEVTKVYTSKFSFTIKDFMKERTRSDVMEFDIPGLTSCYLKVITKNDIKLVFGMDTRIPTDPCQVTLDLKTSCGNYIWVDGFWFKSAFIKRTNDQFANVAFRRSFLEDDGSLVITGSVTVKDANWTEANDIVYFPEMRHAKLLQDIQSLTSSGTLSDFTFIVNGRRLEVHKAILAARSPVFERMFTGDFRESASKVQEIKDVSPDIFEEFLFFLYTGELRNDDTPFEDLIIIADRYQVTDLLKHCESKMLKNINGENAETIYRITNSIQCHTQLKQISFDMIQNSFKNYALTMPNSFFAQPDKVFRSIDLKKELLNSLEDSDMDDSESYIGGAVYSSTSSSPSTIKSEDSGHKYCSDCSSIDLDEDENCSLEDLVIPDV